VLESRVLRKKGLSGDWQERLKVIISGSVTISRALGTRRRTRARGALRRVIADRKSWRRENE
jgi:hypothetical protein